MMREIFPVASGAVVGLITSRYIPARYRIAALVVLSLVLGFTASAISGELELSWGFVPIDVLQVLIVAGLTFAAGTLWARRASRV